MIKDISISERQSECRYWLVYNYGKDHHDVVLWSDNFSRILENWQRKNADDWAYEGRAPYGLACNLSAF